MTKISADKSLKGHPFRRAVGLPFSIGALAPEGMPRLSAATDLPSRHSRSRPGSRRARGAGAGRRFAHAFEQFFEHHGVVVFLIFGAVNQRDLPRPRGQAVKLLQRARSCGLAQFVQIALPERWKIFGPVTKPFAQRIRRCQIFEPKINARFRLFQSARPQAIYQHALAVSSGSFFVNAFDGNRHAAKIQELAR